MTRFTYYSIIILGMAMTLCSVSAKGEQSAFIEQYDQESQYIAEIELHSVEEIKDIIDRADHLHRETQDYNAFKPIALVLHGAEAEVFLRKNYKQYQSLVDTAARLDAFNVIDIKICANWMAMNKVESSELPPFIEKVPFGVLEKQRLKNEGYQSF